MAQKKVRDLPREERLKWIGSKEEPSIGLQCELCGIAESSYYYEPCSESEENLHLMQLLDEQYTETPFYGVRKMTAWLRTEGECVNEKRVRRLLRTMGLETIYQKPQLSKRNPEHRIYPYLLRGVTITRVNQVWSTDITYIRLRKGFVYLTAVIDWYSRYVLAAEVSTTLDSGFCVSALEWALRKGRPEIFNTDQGSQYTSAEFTSILLKHGIAISMDGRGRALDNVFVERLWRTVKYEEVYIKEYSTAADATKALTDYFGFYNDIRLHQNLGYRTPRSVYQEALGANPI